MHGFLLSAPLRLCGLVVPFPLKFSTADGSKKFPLFETIAVMNLRGKITAEAQSKKKIMHGFLLCASQIFPTSLTGVIGARTFLS